MNALTIWKTLPSVVIRLARVTAVMVFTFVLLTAHTQAQEPPEITRHFPNSPGWITIVWEHDGDDVYYLVVERQVPPYGENDIFVVALLNSPTSEFTDMFLKAATQYNHRVCAVYYAHRTCSDWAATTTMPSPSGGSSNEPPPPPPLSIPVIKRTVGTIKQVYTEWDYSYADRLMSMALYRDGKFIFEGVVPPTPPGRVFSFATSYRDPVPRYNSEYTYKLCFSNPDEKNKCSEPVTAMPKPIPPTSPADVNVAVIEPSSSAAGGAARLRNRPRIAIRWRNTDIDGQFITVEALDTLIPGDTMAGGRMESGPQRRWIELTRVSAKDDPTSLTLNRPVSLVTTDLALSTYRVCAVVPSLGDAGKVCSQPVTTY